MADASSGKKTIKTYIHVLVMFILMLGGGVVPAMGSITPLGMKVLGVFLGLIYGWCFIDLFWTSLLGFFALGLTGYMSASSALAAGMSNQVVIISLVAFAMAECLKRVKVTEAIAYWVLSRRIFIDRPWLLAAGIAVTAVLLGMLGGGLAAVFLLWGVISIISKESSQGAGGSLFVSMMYALVLFGFTNGGNVVPFHPEFLMYAALFIQSTGLQIPMGSFLIVGELQALAAVLLMLVVFKCIFRADGTYFRLTEDMCREYRQYKRNKDQKLGLILLVFYFLALVLPTFSFFKQFALFQALQGWGVVGVSILYMLVFTIKKDQDGRPIADMMTNFKDGTIWPVIMLVAITMVVGNAMGSPDTGVTAAIAAACGHAFDGMSVTTLVIAGMILVGLLSQFMHNMVVGVLFIPILLMLVMQMGGNPYVAFFMLRASLASAFATPAASTMAGLLFGRTDVPVEHGYLLGSVFFVVTLLTLVILMPLCQLAFPY